MEISKSNLLDIVYGIEPMTRSLAAAIKKLRCEDRIAYENLPRALNDGFGNDFALGKELCIKARLFLMETEKDWD
jgi:hypothetical protein